MKAGQPYLFYWRPPAFNHWQNQTLWGISAPLREKQICKRSSNYKLIIWALKKVYTQFSNEKKKHPWRGLVHLKINFIITHCNVIPNLFLWNRFYLVFFFFKNLLATIFIIMTEIHHGVGYGPPYFCCLTTPILIHFHYMKKSDLKIPPKKKKKCLLQHAN